MPKIATPATKVHLEGAEAIAVLKSALKLHDKSQTLSDGGKEIAFVQLVMATFIAWQLDTLPANKNDMLTCLAMVEEIIELNWETTAKALKELREN